MIKKILMCFCVMFSLLLVVGCSNNSNGENINKSEVIDSMKVTINGKQYIIKLDDNETVKEFVNMLPREYNMKELNENEKFVYIDNTLPTNPYMPNHIYSGDVMLYGNNCLVIFYKTFDTSYNYTKIGHIDNLEDLGSDDITAIFEK